MVSIIEPYSFSGRAFPIAVDAAGNVTGITTGASDVMVCKPASGSLGLTNIRPIDPGARPATVVGLSTAAHFAAMVSLGTASKDIMTGSGYGFVTGYPQFTDSGGTTETYPFFTLPLDTGGVLPVNMALPSLCAGLGANCWSIYQANATPLGLATALLGSASQKYWALSVSLTILVQYDG